jgi:hypothetical protein
MTKGDDSSKVGNNTVPTEGNGRQLQQQLWQLISRVVVVIGIGNNKNNGNQLTGVDGLLSGQPVWEGKIMLYC